MFKNRIERAQQQLEEFEIDGLLITNAYNISYLTGITAFSSEKREARILITKKNIYLITDPRYSKIVKNHAPFVILKERTIQNPFLKILKQTITKEGVKQLGFEEDNITYKEVADLEEKLINIELAPTQEIVNELRIIKDNDEVEKIKKACQLSDKAFEFILKQLKVGVAEHEIKTSLENFIISKGGKLSFESIIAFGKNSATPHHFSGYQTLMTNDIVLIDFGAKVDGYCSDMSRVVFIGKPSEELKKMYTTTREAQEVALDYLRTHIEKNFEPSKAHLLANSHVRMMGYSDMPHALGHGVGLQVHELPVLSPYLEERLTPGTIITVEPGIYNPKIGGIRIEDTILLTEKGIEILTKSPKELIVI